MSTPSESAKPLTLTRSPKLDAALQTGWESWQTAAGGVGAEGVAGWLGQRLGDAELKTAMGPTIRALLMADEADERGAALMELAELADETEDDLLSDTLWEGVLVLGREAADPDPIFAATGQLAAIAERHGDPLAAAEHYLDFLNWRRTASHTSDPEDVETAFDEIVRLAQRDGAQKEAAIYGYRQACYTRLLEAEDERAVTGDWETDPSPYQGWA